MIWWGDTAGLWEHADAYRPQPGQTKQALSAALSQALILRVVQTLLHHLVGRHWRRPLGAECPEEVAHILGWFQDKPAQQHPFSIHNICRAGRSSE